MKKSPINKVSDNQRRRLLNWHVTCMVKRTLQIAERGYVYCELCNLPERNTESLTVWGHHIISRSRGGKETIENCKLTHWACHQKYHGG